MTTPRPRPQRLLAAAIACGIAGAPAATADPGQIPPVSPPASAAGFVDIRTVIPDAVIDLRYATSENFVGIELYPADARCLIHESMAPGLAVAAQALRTQGFAMVFWDCYRPHTVQVAMFNAVPNPAWVARPGAFARSHETGRSVDVTLAVSHRQCLSSNQRGNLCLVDMGTDFDDFSARATAYATSDVSVLAQTNRATLRNAMTAGGLSIYTGEWWHFDGPGAGVDRPILDVPVN